MGTVCVLAGSPRSGRCVRLAEAVASGVHEAGGQAYLVRLADYEVLGCVGCGACSCTGACILSGRPTPSGRPGFDELARVLVAADALVLVAPIYFSGPPSQLKALLDRLQPFWAQRYLLDSRPVLPPDERKPFELLAVGEGGDPFGWEPLAGCCRSALRMLDYELRATHDFVGTFDEARAIEVGCRMVARLGT